MPEEEKTFEQFFAERIKEKGLSLKRLADITGISPIHIENMLRGDYEEIPSAPYFHAYLVRLGKALDFDGEEWWMKLQKAKLVRKSGEADTLPKNRFLKQAPPNYIWAILVIAIMLFYLGLQAPRILGKPVLTISFPAENPFTTSSSTLVISGMAQNTDSLSLNGDPVTLAADGTWQKGVLLQSGLNTFQISGKKFLGGETAITEQVLYESAGGGAPAIPSSTPSSATSSPTSSSTASSTPGGAPTPTGTPPSGSHYR